MDTREKEIENLKDYKYGFTTDIENIRAPKGLNEEVIKFISRIKKDYGQVNILLHGYQNASAYPQCFDNFVTKEQKLHLHQLPIDQIITLR